MKKYVIFAILGISCNYSSPKKAMDKYQISTGIKTASFVSIDSNNWIGLGYDGRNRHYMQSMVEETVYFIDVKKDTSAILKEWTIILDSASPDRVCKLKEQAKQYINNLNQLDSCK